MKCSCSLNNNYNIINSCDIDKFNQQINNFDDKSYTQILLPRILSLSSTNLPIKNISEVHLSINIASTKVLKSPKSKSFSNENLNLTGILLIVSGAVCETISYLTTNPSKPIQFVKFTIPFHTYIVMDEDFNIGNDDFFIYSCIENVFLNPLDEIDIIQNISLFLFAHRIIGDIKKLQTFFIFKTFDSNEEMGRVEFDITNYKLIISSTGKSYNDINTQTAFNFTLKNSDETVIKASKSILGNENLDEFKKFLNNNNFELGDIVEITYSLSSKVSLNNYPDIDDVYPITKQTFEKFIITENEVSPILTQNKIIVKSKDFEKVMTICFSKEDPKIIVSLNKIIPNPSLDKSYFTLILKDINGVDLIRATLNSNEDGTLFKSKINFNTFSMGENSLTLIYRDKSKIEILNYPNIGNNYTPNLNFNIFKIDRENLFDIAIKSTIKILNYNNEEMSTLYFTDSTLNSKVITIATLTKAISSTTIAYNQKYLEFLQYSNHSYILYSEILSRKDALDFNKKLDGTNIELTPVNILRLSSKLDNKIIITNYKNQDNYITVENTEFLEIHKDSLIAHSLNYNKIIVKNSDDLIVLSIYFDKLTSNLIYIEPCSIKNANIGFNLFTLKITDPTESIIKLQGKIDYNETGYKFKLGPQPYNISKNLSIEDILTIEYSDSYLIEIFNFPFSSTYYKPTGHSQKFKIKENGLITSKLSETSITFKGFYDFDIAKIRFDVNLKKLIVTSTGTKAHIHFKDVEYFAFVLKTSNNIIKKEASVKGDENANSFRDILNNTLFDYDDIIELRNKENTRIIIFNYPNEGGTSNPFLQKDIFKITINGLEVYFRFLKNVIYFYSKLNYIVSMIRFNISLKTLSIATSRTVASSDFTGQDSFVLILKDSNGIIKNRASIKGNETAKNFTSILDNTPFEYGYILTLEYIETSKVKITNYPKFLEKYIPSNNTMTFIITKNGLFTP